MRRGFGFVGLVLTLIVPTIGGLIAYNVGWSERLAAHVTAGTAAAPPDYYGYGPHFFGGGFGIFGLFWFLFILFGLFFLFRLAFFGRRHWGGGGWGDKGGPGHGQPPGIDGRKQEW